MQQLHNAEVKRILNIQKYQENDDGSGDVVFAVFLEPHEPPPGSPQSTFFEHLINFAVKHLQSEPVMAHVELVVPCAAGREVYVNFATYIGEKSGWQRDKLNNELYYLVNNANKWRAVPVFGKNIAKAVREKCNECQNVEYSIRRYVTSSWAFRGLAALIPDSLKSPAHCATLTARILRNVDTSSRLKHPSPFYGPASLYAELVEHLRHQSIMPESTMVNSETAVAVEKLLRHGDDDVECMDDETCLGAIRALTLKAASAEAYGDTAIKILTQKQLATVLFRWSVIRNTKFELKNL